MTNWLAAGSSGSLTETSETSQLLTSNQLAENCEPYSPCSVRFPR
jgi:hypothetical protein